jgi:xylulokinase
MAVPRALQSAGLRGDDIACLGFSGQMHGAVMLDESGRVVRPALIWCDVRTDRQCRELTEKIGAERIIQLTCNPALANFTLTKFLWVRENEPENWKRVRSVMLPKDYVRYQLTGERLRDSVARCGQPALVERDAGSDRNRSRPAARTL